jgi:hypothetical protein
MDFSQRLGHIGEEHDAHAARDDIKGLGGERGFRVPAGSNVGHVAGGRSRPPAASRHEIRGGDDAPGTNRECGDNAGSPVPLARSKTCIPGVTCAACTMASVAARLSISIWGCHFRHPTAAAVHSWRTPSFHNAVLDT